MSDHNPFRDEIEQILLKHPRTRYAKVLIGMKQNLTDIEIAAAAAAAGEPVKPDRITEVRRNVQLTLDDKLGPPSEAEMQAGLNRAAQLPTLGRTQSAHQDATDLRPWISAIIHDEAEASRAAPGGE